MLQVKFISIQIQLAINQSKLFDFVLRECNNKQTYLVQIILGKCLTKRFYRWFKLYSVKSRWWFSKFYNYDWPSINQCIINMAWGKRDTGEWKEQFQMTLATYKHTCHLILRWHFISLVIFKYISDLIQKVLWTLANWHIWTDPGHWQIDFIRWRTGRWRTSDALAKWPVTTSTGIQVYQGRK